MRNSFKALMVAVIVMLPSVIFAQKTLKFGHINSAEIIQLMPEKDSAVAKLQKVNKELSATYEGMNVELNTKYQKFQEDQKNLTDLLKKTRQDEISQLQQRIEQFKESANEEIQKNQTEFMQPVLEKVKKAIADVGKENGFIYVFDIGQGSNILYFSADSQDVTTLVKAKLGLKK